MKPVLLTAIICMAAAAWSTDGAAAKGGATAKAKLSEARAAAKKWQPDATLVTLSALKVNDDGTAPAGAIGWTYTFYSPKTGKWLGISIEAAGLDSLSLPAGLKVPVPDQFVDSDKVLQEVAKHGYKKSGDTMVQLNVYYHGIKPGVYWCATRSVDMPASAAALPKSWCVDPASGKFVARLEGGSTQAPQAAKPAPESTFTVDLSKCGGFAAADAAPHLGVSAAQVKTETAKVSDAEWKCTFSAGGKALAFTITAAPSVKEAQARIAKYSKTLKDDYTELSLSKGAEGVWSNASSTLTVRRGNIIVRTLQPAEKLKQVKLADSVAAKF